MRHQSPPARRPSARTLIAGGALVALVSASAAPASAQGGGRHCGEVNNNQTWQPTETHIVTCDVVVKSSTLTIAPGVLVLMNEGTSLIVEPGAALVAPGNTMTRQPVRFQPNTRTPAPGFWGQVLVKAGALESTLSDVTFEYGGASGKPMLEVHSAVSMNLLGFQSAMGVPLALDANVLGPSLAGAGATPGACERVTFSRNGEQAIQVLPRGGAGGGDVLDTQTWFPFCVPYRALAPLAIGGPDRPTLTLNPGVNVEFGPGAGIAAGVDTDNLGQLEASGSTEEGRAVVLTGVAKTPGAWPGLDLNDFTDPDGLGHGLTNARVEYGGEGGRAMVRVRTPNVLTIDSTFAHAAGYPVEIRPDAVDGFVSGLTQPAGAFVGNGVQRIRVLADAAEVDLPISATWKDAGVPFEINGDFLVAGQGEPAVFRLEGGAVLLFKDGTTLAIGDRRKGPGAFEVRGSRRTPAVLAAESAAPGSWFGLRITDDARQAQVTGLRVEHGGRDGTPMVEWGRVPGTMKQSAFRGAARYPLAVAFTRLTAVAGEEQRDSLERNTFEGNGVDRILVRVDGVYAERSAIWADPGAPLEFEGDAVVARNGGGALNLFSGLDLRFPAGKGFQIGQGTARASVSISREAASAFATFGPLDEAAGWSGVTVVSGASLEGDGLRVTGVRDDAAGLRVQGGVVSLKGADFSGRAPGTGIGVDASGGQARVELSESRVVGHRIGVRTRDGARLTMTRSAVSGNREWGVLNEDETLCQVATLVYWGSPDGPHDASEARDFCMNTAWEGKGDKVSDHVQWWRYAVDAAFTPAEGLGPNPKIIYLPAGYREASARDAGVRLAITGGAATSSRRRPARARVE